MYFAGPCLSFTSDDMLSPAEWIGRSNNQRLLTETLFQTAAQR